MHNRPIPRSAGMTPPLHQAGFTLGELMVVVLILSILLAVGVPSFRTMIQNNQMTSEVNEFVTSLQLARSEAVKRNVDAVVCALEDGQAPTDCGVAASGANWEFGYIVFVDVNEDGDVDAGTGACLVTEDCILNVGDGFANGTMREADPAQNPVITYESDSTTDRTAASTIIFCDSRGVGHAKTLILTTTGRPKSSTRLATGAAVATCTPSP